MIETGYRPEFALGALYQGLNAANADQESQQDILKKFLANQREQALMPTDVEQAKQNLLASMYKSDPRYQKGMTDMIEGQGLSNLVAGQNASVLQPFTQEARKAELVQEGSKNRLFGNMYQGLEQQHNKELQPDQREAAGQGAFFLADSLAQVDPKFMQQKALLEQRGDQAMDLLDTKLAANEKLAALKGQAVKGSKTAQEAYVKYLDGLLASGQISSDTYAKEIAEFQNALNSAKIQPGPELNLNNPQLGKVFQPKPQQPQVTPPVVGQPAQPDKTPMTMEKLRGLYPGIPDDKLRKAYKDKFGEELK